MKSLAMSSEMGTGFFSVVLLAEINYGENSYYYSC